ncbi:MAG: urea transporter [Planctomycetaceae bacterium]
MNLVSTPGSTGDAFGGAWGPALLVRVVLRGVGQVMFQGNAATGLLFLVGMAIASWPMALAALLGAVIGPVVALFCGFDRAEIEDGIYGYNPALVGAAAIFLLPQAPITWGLLTAACVVSVFVTWAMRRGLPFPAYTAGFVVTTWAMLFAAQVIGDIRPVISGGTLPVPSHDLGYLEFGKDVLAGVAEVMFGADWMTGLCFVAGLVVGSWRHALVALLGAALGTLVAVYHNDSEASVRLGIYGFNSALAAIACYLARPSLVAVAAGAAISVPLMEFFPTGLGLRPLTAPFIVASWIVLLLMKIDTLLAPKPG